MGWSRYIPVTLDDTQPVAPTASPFQVPINLSPASGLVGAGNLADLFAYARSDGADVKATDDAGNALNFDLASWNQAGQTGKIWVAAPVTGGSSSTVRLWYQNPAQATTLGSYSGTMTRVSFSSGVVGQYLCDDGSGSSLAERLGGTAAQVVNGPPTWSASGDGFGGDQIALNGTNQAISLPYPTLNAALPAAGTILFDLIPTANTSGYSTNTLILSLIANTLNGGNSMQLYFGSSTHAGAMILTTVYNGGSPVTAIGPVIPFTAGTTYRVAYSWNSSLRCCWVNGVPMVVQATNTTGNVGLCAGQTALNTFMLGAQPTSASNAAPTLCLAASFKNIVILDHQAAPGEIQADFQKRVYAAGMFQDTRWGNYQVVKNAPAYSGGNVNVILEPSFLYVDSTHQELFFTNGPNQGVGQLHSTNGFSYSDAGSNPVVATDAHGSQAILFGSTYYLFYTRTNAGVPTVFYKSSSTGLAGSWAGETTTGITVTSISQAWATNNLWRVCAFLDPNDNTWKMLLEGDDGSQYRLGLFTTGNSTFVGATWTKYASNPLSTLAPQAGGGFSGPRLVIDALGVYHVWYHGSAEDFGPSLIYHSTSTDLHAWTTPQVVLQMGTQNFAGTSTDQFANPDPQQIGSSCRLYHDEDYQISNGARLSAWTYAGTMAQLLTDPPLISFGGPVSVPATLYVNQGPREF